MDRRYVGIDLYRRRSVISAMSAVGEKLFCERVANEPLRLLEVVSAAGEGAEVVIEGLTSNHRDRLGSGVLWHLSTRTMRRTIWDSPTRRMRWEVGRRPCSRTRHDPPNLREDTRLRSRAVANAHFAREPVFAQG